MVLVTYNTILKNLHVRVSKVQIFFLKKMYVLAVRTTLYNIFFLKQLLIKHRYIYTQCLRSNSTQQEKKSRTQMAKVAAFAKSCRWSLDGLAALVTGGTSGIGYYTF